MSNPLIYADQHQIEATDFGFRVLNLLLVAFEGRLPREVKHSSYQGEHTVAIRLYEESWITTTGPCLLSRLVIAAHERRIRLCIRPGSSQSLTLLFFDAPYTNEDWAELDDVIDTVRADLQV